MCGRFSQSADLARLQTRFAFAPPGFAFRRRYNLAPTQEAAVVLVDDGERRLALLRWGLVPSWAKDPSIGGRMINARAETARGKPSFRRAFASSRCVVPADGFYEWKREGEAKRPMRIVPGDGGLLALAGLWERWRPGGDGELRTFAILTVGASDDLRPIHDRMPVVLDDAGVDLWLDPAAPPDRLEALLRPAPAGSLRSFEVSPAVNNPRNDVPECLRPLA